ncbi:ABC transporter permease [Paenibacillus planticolens]|uniref:Ribose ABC transporter permease n=1 Tax=Paenibacillus planticolens TaxID=2654976 RepID=A0ABX1ZJ58_9BACL|nr:ABC transporter permease [Paenibacillus planticolens]NOV00051.1 ribose ABC transporter permease [Paenibacillus planticolens]
MNKRYGLPLRVNQPGLAWRFVQKNHVFLIIVVFFVIASVTSDYFLSWENLMNLFRQASVVGMIALGVHFVILLGMVDFSVGSVLVFSGSIIMVLQGIDGFGIWLSSIAGVIAGMLLGLLNGVIVVYGKVPSFITTLGMMFAVRSISLWYASGGALQGKYSQYTSLGHGYTLGIPNILFPLILAAILAHIVLTRTLLGRYIYAVGNNRIAAFLSGTPMHWVTIIAFGISGLAAGVGAILETSRLNSISTSSSATTYELDVIAAIVIGGANLSGGKGTIWGTACGVLILSMISNYMNLENVSPYLQGILKGILMLAVLYKQKKMD